MKRFCWFQEYKHCSCSQIELTKQGLLNYCKRHGNSSKMTIRIPYKKGLTIGFLET